MRKSWEAFVQSVKQRKLKRENSSYIKKKSLFRTLAFLSFWSLKHGVDVELLILRANSLGEPSLVFYFLGFQEGSALSLL